MINLTNSDLSYYSNLLIIITCILIIGYVYSKILSSWFNWIWYLINRISVLIVIILIISQTTYADPFILLFKKYLLTFYNQAQDYYLKYK